MARQTVSHSARGGISQLLLGLPMGTLAIGIFLWLISVCALLGVLALLVHRPLLVFTSESSEPLVSEKS